MTVSGVPTNPHFGFYLFPGTSLDEGKVSAIAGRPGWKGVTVAYYWDKIEPSQGVIEDWIKRDMEICAGYDLAFMFMLIMYNTKTTIDGWPRVPEWLWQDSNYPYCNIPNKYGIYFSAQNSIYPILWDSMVMDRYTDVFKRIIADLKTSPQYDEYFEGCATMETSYVEPAEGAGCGWDCSAIEALHKQFLLDIKADLPDKMVYHTVTFPCWDADPYRQWCRDNNIVLGLEDTKIHNMDLCTKQICDYKRMLKAGRPYFGSICQVSWRNYTVVNDVTGATATPEELIRHDIEHIDPWYIKIDARRPYFENRDGTLDSLYAEWQRPVKTNLEVVQMITVDEEWDLGHGYDGTEPPPDPGKAFVTSWGGPLQDVDTRKATFTLGCDNCRGSELIQFELGGDAIEGVHYTIDKTSPQLPGTELTVHAINTGQAGPNVTVTCTVIDGPDYDIRNPTTASIQILNTNEANPYPGDIIVDVDGNIQISGQAKIKAR